MQGNKQTRGQRKAHERRIRRQRRTWLSNGTPYSPARVAPWHKGKHTGEKEQPKMKAAATIPPNRREGFIRALLIRMSRAISGRKG